MEVAVMDKEQCIVEFIQDYFDDEIDKDNIDIIGCTKDRCAPSYIAIALVRGQYFCIDIEYDHEYDDFTMDVYKMVYESTFNASGH